MEIKIDVKFNIGDRVYVKSHNNRMDTDGEGIIEGYVINKTKKSCKVYYLVEGRGNYRRKYRYTVGELELIDNNQKEGN